MHQPVAHSPAEFFRFIGGECDVASIGSPDRYSHNLSGRLFKRDLTSLAARQIHHPQISMSAVVREICHLPVIRTQRRGLHLSGLVSDPDRAFHVVGGIPIHGKFPDIELHVAAAHQDSAIPIHIRALISGFSKRHLPRLSALYRKLP